MFSDQCTVSLMNYLLHRRNTNIFSLAKKIRFGFSLHEVVGSVVIYVIYTKAIRQLILRVDISLVLLQ